MNSCCTGKLRQTTHGILYFSRCNHHQIRELVHNNNNLWHLLIIRVIFVCQFVHFRIIGFDITNTCIGKFLISSGHLCYRPTKCCRCLLRIFHNRNHQMWNIFVCSQFHHLWVNHNHFYFIRIRFINNTHNQRINQNRFTGTSRTGNQ